VVGDFWARALEAAGLFIGWLTNLALGVTIDRPLNRLERRQQIVKALVRVMAERGYEGATVAKVAREAGLTPGLVHYHFKSKGEILLAVVDDVQARLRARVRRQASIDGQPRARLASLLDAFVAAGDDPEPAAVATWVLLGAEALKRPEVATAFAAALEEAEQALEEAVTAVLHDEGRDLQAARPTALALLCAI
jgi:TetR/AcrR family transcriptional regulator, transcriptional repressor of bet genes